MVATRSSTRSASASATPAPAPAPAGNSLEIDPVSKARTIAHMNKDHAADLSAILRHRAGLTEAQAAAARPEMLDLDLATLTIATTTTPSPDNQKNNNNNNNNNSPTIHTIALDPPMAHWNDRRARLIDMTLEARKALGLPISSDDAQEQQHALAASSSSSSGSGSGSGSGSSGAAPAVVQWYPPEGADLVPFTIVLFDYVASLLVWTGQLAPGTALWRLLDGQPCFLASWFPGGTAGFAWAVTTACPLVAGIHLLEMVWFDRTRLAPAGVRRASAVWFLWLGCQLVDGFATFQRWERRVVAGKGKGKGAKSL